MLGNKLYNINQTIIIAKTILKLKRLVKVSFNFCCLLVIILLTNQIATAQQTKRLFLIGNSVTDGINYDGLKALAESRTNTHISARHMIPGSPLQLLWEARNGGSGFTEAPYGFPQQAFTNYQWDAISLQPFDRLLEGDPTSDLDMVNNYINLAKTNSPNVQFYLYSRYPRTPGDVAPTNNVLTAASWNTIWNTTYVNDWGGNPETKDFFEKLIVRVRATSTIAKPVLMVPCGDVMKALNDKMAAGQIPGYTKIWQVYADGIHMNNIGSYILACTYYATLYKDSPVGIGVPSQYGSISSALATTIQQTVWEVVSTHPSAGISGTVTIPVTGVSLSATNTSVAVNQNFQLTATISPSNATNQSINWTSSNTAVATVSNTGSIRGVSVGAATITATTVSGNKIATCNATVSSGNIAVTSISVSPATLGVKVGNSSTLSATVSPANATNSNFTWSSSNNAIATVDATGKVTALATGSAILTATTIDGSKTATCTFTALPNAAPNAVITATPISGVSPLVVAFSSAGSADADAGDFILGYEWDFGDGSAINKSASPSYTYTTAGTFIAKLKVMDNNNLFGAQVSRTITVTQGNNTNIATLGVGAIWQDIPAATSTSDASKVINAAINDANTAVDVVLTDVNSANNWQAAGLTWATAQTGITSVKFYNGFTANIIQDNGVFAEGIKLQSTSDGTNWTDVSGWTISPSYTYLVTASNQIYTLTGAALNNVRGIRVVGQLRLAANEYQTSWAIKVKEIEVFGTTTVSVTGVTLSPTTSSINVGATTALTATVAPANATNKNVTYVSNNTAIATVSATGVVTGVAAGSANITTTTVDGAKTATSAITVTTPVIAVTSVTLSPTTASVNVGATTALTATVAPANATNKNVTYASSNTAIATVSATGVVTGVAAGTATITVTTVSGAKTATSAITVNAVVTSGNLALTGTGAIWQDIPAATSTSDASKLANVGINNANLTTDVVAVDVTAVNNWQAAGLTWATAQTGITSVKFYNGTTTNIINENGIFSAGVKIQSSTNGTTWTDVSGWSFTPAYIYTVAASNQIYTFSGAALNNVRGIRVVGQLRLQATEYQTSWAIKVKEVEVFGGVVANVAVASVAITPPTATINIGATTALTATVSPANATNKNVTFASNNTAIATVSATGVVTGVTAGLANITVTTVDGAKTATSAITVTTSPVIAVTGVNITPTTASILVGGTTSVTAAVLPSNATNKTVTYSSNNTSIATVSASGLVTAIAVGNANITATASTFTATSTITVNSAVATTRTNNIGMNTSNPGIDYSTDVVFADAMRSHRYWDKIVSSASDDAPKDANYWPITDATCLVWAGAQNTHGTYKLSFLGQANVTTGDAVISNLTYNSATNITSATVTVSLGNGQLYLNFTNTKRTAAGATNTGVTNVKLMRPLTKGSTQSYPESTLFCTELITQLAPFKCIRSLGWLAVNWNQDSLWSDRTLMQHARQSPPKEGKAYGWEGRGSSFESLILFANQAQKDVWLNVPHKVNDDYVTKLALLFKYGSDGVNPYTSVQSNPVYPPLNSSLKLYVEYSNEIWNDQFSQTGWVYEKSKTNAAVKFDGSTDIYEWGMRYRALRTVQMGILFRNVFGSEMMTRIRPVFASQKGYLGRTGQSMLFIDKYYNKRDSRSTWATPNPVNYYLYGYGSSFYWNTNGPVNVNSIWNSGSWNATAVWNDAYGNPGGFYDLMHTDAAWAKQFGLAYINYEGDSHPNYDGDEVTIKQLHTGTWDSRYYQNTLEHLNVLNQVDAELSCFLVLNGGEGSDWAIRNVNNPANSPQYDAVTQFVASTPLAITAGSMAPFTKPGNGYSTSNIYSWPNPTGTGSSNISANYDYCNSYLFRVPNNGSYNVKVEYNTNATAILQLEYAGNVVGTYNLSNTNGAPTITTGVNINCEAGKLYSIRVIALSGTISINNIIVGVGNAVMDAKVAPLLTKESKFSIYPNPATDFVNVNFKDDSASIISIYSINGTKISESKSKNKNVQLDVSKLNAGLYLLKIQSGTEVKFNKIEITR